MSAKDFGRIGVLMGGSSSEREISLRSGWAVVNALKEEGGNVLPIDIDDNLNQARKRLEETQLDVAFIALHGRFGEDGAIQQLLESLGIPYTGSGVQANSLALNKVASRKIFENAAIAIPRYKVVTSQISAGDDNFHFPLVVKPSSQGSSIGLSIVENKQSLSSAVSSALEYNKEVIVEEYIPGKEITVGIFDDHALPVIQIVSRKRFYDYQAKYEAGFTDYLVPAPLSEDEYLRAQETGLSAHHCLGCYAFSRVDMIIHKGRPIVLEVNTIPGLTSASLFPKAAKVAGISFKQLCLKLVELAVS